jgi:branched-chain amino acid transport system permease protein
MGIDGALMLRVVSFLSGAIGGAAGVLVGLNFKSSRPASSAPRRSPSPPTMMTAKPRSIMCSPMNGWIASYLSSTLKDMIAFGLLVATLWFRPMGLFGRAAAKRAASTT